MEDLPLMCFEESKHSSWIHVSFSPSPSQKYKSLSELLIILSPTSLSTHLMLSSLLPDVLKPAD